MLIWRNKKQKKPSAKSVVTETYETEEVEADVEDDVIVTDEAVDLPEADVTSSVVRRTKKGKA